MNSPIRVFFLVPYPLRSAPSQRFRVELFLPTLEKAGIQYRFQSFIDEKTLKILYKNGHFFLKALGILRGFIQRMAFVFFRASSYNYIFIHREASPIGPPFFEWWLAKVLRKRIIYDFDDAIWIPNTSSANRLISWFKSFWKVKYLCGWAYKVVCGNDYLCSYANQFNQNVIKIPTCVDVKNGRSYLKELNRLNIGWVGSHSTLKYIDEIAPVLDRLQQECDFTFIVIADERPSLALKSWQFVRWREPTETEDISRFDIGVMPLVSDAWSEGKCGFKLIQYLSLGIPAVASPVGVNKSIIQNGVNGFLCETDKEWENALKKLISNENLRREMGFNGRRKIEQEFSIQSQTKNFLGLFS